MRNYDLSPLYRSTVGFDRLFGMLDSLGNYDGGAAPTYPPYNIERTGENAYRVTLAVAGFGENDIRSRSRKARSPSPARRKRRAESDGKEVLYRGIAARSFERRFQLADHVQVTGADARERPPPCRSRPRDSRSDEAPHHRHQRQHAAEGREAGRGQGRRVTARSGFDRSKGALRGALFLELRRRCRCLKHDESYHGSCRPAGGGIVGLKPQTVTPGEAGRGKGAQ